MLMMMETEKKKNKKIFLGRIEPNEPGSDGGGAGFF